MCVGIGSRLHSNRVFPYATTSYIDVTCRPSFSGVTPCHFNSSNSLASHILSPCVVCKPKHLNILTTCLNGFLFTRKVKVSQCCVGFQHFTKCCSSIVSDFITCLLTKHDYSDPKIQETSTYLTTQAYGIQCCVDFQCIGQCLYSIITDTII